MCVCVGLLGCHNTVSLMLSFFSMKFERWIKSVGVIMIVVNTSIRLSVMFSYCKMDHSNISLSKSA